jgi:hypothetical protein
MSLFSKSKQVFTAFIVFSFFSLGMLNIANAAIIDSNDIVSERQGQFEREQLKSLMTREDIREQLVDLGVDIDAAIARVDSMTDLEAQQLAARMEELPAGEGFIEFAVLAFLVLIILEVTGVTDILPNI